MIKLRLYMCVECVEVTLARVLVVCSSVLVGLGFQYQHKFYIGRCARRGVLKSADDDKVYHPKEPGMTERLRRDEGLYTFVTHCKGLMEAGAEEVRGQGVGGQRIAALLFAASLG